MNRLALAVAVLCLAALPAVALGSAGSVEKLTASLSGTVEVPPGAPSGAGKVTITVNDRTGRVCWTFTGLKNLQGAPQVSHIHKGKAGVAGPVVVPLGGAFKARGCTTTSTSLAKSIEKHPGSYYVNIHNAKFPGGAVRGQLRSA
jgi:hypothetical protein